MRHTSEILKELGFNEEASESTKQAFLKHLERAANIEKSTLPTQQSSSLPEQLSFEFTFQTDDVESDQLELPLKTNLQSV